MPYRAPGGAPSVPALLHLGTIAAPRIMCLPVGRLGWAGSRLGALGPHPPPVSTPWPCCLLALWVQGADHSTLRPPQTLPCLGMGVSAPRPLQPALAATGLRGASCCHHCVPAVGARGRNHGAEPWHPGLFCGRRAPPPVFSPHSIRDAGLRVTLTLLPARPGLVGSICSSLSLEGEPGKPLGCPGLEPQ